ncbi:MAG: DUF2961 domain-containing protein [Armatimonadota bacterium]|nr:DUF2961 domain-containing protein [Armatimonadota bacterium]
MRKLSSIFILAMLVMTAASAVAAPIPTGDLLELIDPELPAYLRDSVCTQVSSYDPNGGNNDGFTGAYSYIRKEGENLVIFDAKGPGCIYRIWSADPLDGWVKLYFDGEEKPRLELEHFRDMFTNKVYPFVPPLSRNLIGGWCSYVPIPFAKSLKIVAGGPVQFLQITWQKFQTADSPSPQPSPAKGERGQGSCAGGGREGERGPLVKTFDPNYSTEDRVKLTRVRKVWSNLGKPPKPFPVTAKEAKGEIAIAPGETGEIARLDGAGLVRGIRLKAQCADVKFKRKVLLLMGVDGRKEPNIYSPLGDFFLDPFDGENCQSLLVGKDQDTYYSYWVMPYAAGTSIELKNESVSPLKLTYQVVYEPMKKLPKGMGRFFAWWHRQYPTVEGQPFTILEADGRGQYCGVSHAMQDERVGLAYLEGDEMMWIDYRDNAAYNGTGTEDYFCGGWYFGGDFLHSAPFYGCGFRSDWGRCHAYRLQITDLVPFQEHARIVIEHGPGNNWQSDYAGVTYWYAEPGTTHTFKPTAMPDRLTRRWPKPNAVEAEALFDPKAGGKVATDYNETFCMGSGKGVSTAQGKAGESFNMTINAPDSGVYYLYTGFAKGPGRGVAQLSVDGKPVGRNIDTYSAQSDEGIPVPVLVGATQELTKGPHRLTVTAGGKNEASAGASVVLDTLVLRPELFYEGESLQVTGAKGGSHSIETQGPEVSDFSILWFTADGPGSTIALRIPVLKSGTYRITLHLRRFWNSGNAKFAVDGKPAGPEFEGFDGWGRAEHLALGPMELAAGDHELTIEVTGKQKESLGHRIGVDAVWLSAPR